MAHDGVNQEDTEEESYFKVPAEFSWAEVKRAIEKVEVVAHIQRRCSRLRLSACSAEKAAYRHRQAAARGIQLLYYNWQGKHPHLPNLGKMLASAKETNVAIVL